MLVITSGGSSIDIECRVEIEEAMRPVLREVVKALGRQGFDVSDESAIALEWYFTGSANSPDGLRVNLTIPGSKVSNGEIELRLECE